MTLDSFSGRRPIEAVRLPLTLISLEDWVLISITGKDSQQYLQGQVTADVHQIKEYHHVLTAQCEPNGRVLSIFRLFRHQGGFALIERRSLHDIQMIEMKKYAIFSKVIIAVDRNHILLGIAGFKARTILKKLFNILPNIDRPLINDGSTSILWFKYPTERFLLVIDFITAKCVIEAIKDKAQLNNSQQWLTMNIEAGEPVIDIENSRKFIPQAINLQALGGISFKKGCYVGQEIIARTKSRGANKRSLQYLAGYANRIPKTGEELEMKIGLSGWRRAGTILATVQIDDGRLLVQAVMNNHIEQDYIFRVRGDNNTLNIKPLPYSIK